MNSMEQQANTDGYVECGECGHPIEEHGLTGCETCAGFIASEGMEPSAACTERWTKADIKRRRRELGLPGEYSAYGEY